MAGIITISKGHDASYPWRQIGTTAGKTRSAETGAGYYLSPAEKGGEPPGTWTGRGVAELGLEPGGIVDRAVFEPPYGRHLDPRDPSGETRLGRAPGKFWTAETIYESLLAAEPEATSERRAELLIEASSMARTPDLYWDATFSLSKSISRFTPAHRPARRSQLSEATRPPSASGSRSPGDLGRGHGGQRCGPGLSAARGRVAAGGRTRGSG